MSQLIETLKELFKPLHIEETESGDVLMISPLMYHVAVYVNPDIGGGFEDRYCIPNVPLAVKAITEFKQTGTMRYWQKHWNQRISIKGNLAFNTGDLMTSENALYQVDWNIDEIRQEYGLKPLL